MNQMNPVRITITCLLAVAINSVCISGDAMADIRVGVAAVDISPPLGAPMAGYYSARGCTGHHDPLHATAMVIESDGNQE